MALSEDMNEVRKQMLVPESLNSAGSWSGSSFYSISVPTSFVDDAQRALATDTSGIQTPAALSKLFSS